MKFAYFKGQTHCRASQQFVASSSPYDSLIADSRFKFRLNKLIGDVYSFLYFRRGVKLCTSGTGVSNEPFHSFCSLMVEYIWRMTINREKVQFLEKTLSQYNFV